MDIREMADRLAIQDLLVRYCFAIDDRDWDALDGVFTPDAHIDYSETGGAVGSLAEIKRWLPAALARFPRYQHYVTNTCLDFDGDRVTARTMLFNPLVYRSEDGAEAAFFIGLCYRDVLVRTDAGWRIAERVEVLSWTHNVPEMPAVPSLADVLLSNNA
jgi:3-phenylpropionate/cinnamic acid dioxygenase small subunit